MYSKSSRNELHIYDIYIHMGLGVVGVNCAMSGFITGWLLRRRFFSWRRSAKIPLILLLQHFAEFYESVWDIDRDDDRERCVTWSHMHKCCSAKQLNCSCNYARKTHKILLKGRRKHIKVEKSAKEMRKWWWK